MVLGIPEQYEGTRCLCTNCHTKFSIPAFSEADIMDVIGRGKRGDSAIANALDAEEPQAISQEEVSVTAAEISMDTTEGFSAGAEGFCLIRIDHNGALFEFRASLLLDETFRGCLPRRCVRCGQTRHIHPHLTIFAHHMTESSSLESQYISGWKGLAEKDIHGKSITDILRQLPEIRKIPAPGNLPMPYWVCDMCNPSNMIYAQNKITGDGQGVCRLQIQRIWRAEEFLVAAGGKNSDAHREILRVLAGNAEQPWDTLSGAVQQRLQQWYRPHKGERFIAYIPDRMRVRTQDGMGGLVLSNRRLIHNCPPKYHEAERGERLDMDFARSEGKMTLHIRTPSWEVRKMVVDKRGLERLRRAMWKEKFPAVWH